MKIEDLTKALADPTRLRILRLLATMDLAVGEVAHVLGQSQPRVSRHVAILCASGLAERRREGSWIFLRLTISPASPDGLSAAIANLLNAAEGGDEVFAARCAEDRRHLAAIRRTRQKQAAEYFARHAEDWDNLRAMLSPFKDVESLLQETLSSRPVGRLLDIGTGTGKSAMALARQADHIVGLDRSPEMLRLARAELQDLPHSQWELVHGDFLALPFEGDSFDTVLLHQVLHYASDPAMPIAEAARVCRPGGRVVIVDLAAHEHEELRERHAHERLGFTDEQMLGWLTQNDLLPAATETLPGNGLTIKLWIGQRTSRDTESQDAPSESEAHA